MTGRVVTFYSYKGGVGRSFLLANAAAWLARVGFRVLCVDWDLEAPGLHHYFQERGLLLPGPRTGLVNLLTSIQKRSQLDWNKLVRDVNVPEAKGELALLDAGDAASSEYGRALAALSWKDLYESEDLGQRLEELRAQWVSRYDLVFLDSRTGLTDSGGVCTAQLPDIVVLVFAPNIQGLEGTLGIVKKARTQRSLLPIGRGGFLVLPVASRFDPNAAGDAPEKWMRILAERLQPSYDEWREKDVAPEKLATLLRVPYSPRWSFGEPLPVLEESADDPSSVSYAITSIAAFLVRGLAESRRLVEQRNGYVAEVVERNRALLGGEAHDAPAFRYDIFLSFSGPDREFAREVAQLLEQRKRRVFFDERSIDVGQRWVETLANGLREARGLVSIVGAKPSSWQRAEVDLFRSQVKDDGVRFVLPVLRAEQPDWPELFAFQAILAAGRSSAQVAAEIHERLLLRESPKSAADAAAVEQAPRLWSESEALDAYRVWVAKEHERLVPYFQGASDMLLEQVCVRIDLEPTPARADESAPESFSNSKVTESAPSGPRTLEGLLLPSIRTTPAPRWIVMGEPGAGKTTLARSLARAHSKSGAVVPVFVPLARLNKAKLDPLAFAVADVLGAEERHSSRARVLIQALRERESQGDLLLLFDGLDEVDPERVDELLKAIVAYANEHQLVPLALLGRPIAFERRDLPEQFRRARVLALKPEQQDLLLSKLLGDNEGARVRAHLSAHPALADLAKSPLLLTLLAVVARDTVLAESALPASRGKLYQTAIDLLLRRGFGIEKKGVKDTQPARRLLQMLSLRLHEQGGETWTRANLAEVLMLLRRTDEEANFLVKETWGTNDAFLEDVGTNAGVLGAHDGPHLPWRYLHRSLREFLVAEEVSRWSKEAIEAHLAEWARVTEERAEQEESDGEQVMGPDPGRWGEVYALLCTLVPDPLVILDTLGRLSSELALRTLVSVDVLTPPQVLEYLVRLDGWDPAILQTLLRRWSFPAPKALELLRSVVTSRASTEALAHLWDAMEALAASPEREDFFARCKRPLPVADLIPWATIPGGTFLMGSPRGKGDSDERPQHRRTITGFQLARTTVTRAQYRAFDPGRVFDDEYVHDPAAEGLPANGLSRYEAILYCRWLGARLPSEAEWEYACRAGTTSEYWSGDKEKDLERVGWYSGNSKGQLQRVAMKPANPFGLHDMHGNVWEWCEDTWHWDYSEAPKDGLAWVDEASENRIGRGGSFGDSAGHARSAYRGGDHPSGRWKNLGFRPARSVTTD